jgi:hypothetical protein
MKKQIRSAKRDADQSMIDGVNKVLATCASLPVGSTTVTPADIVKVLQDRIDASKAVLTAEAARSAAVKVDRDKRAQSAAFVQSLRRMIQGMFTQSPDTLAAFGLKAPKAPKKTVTTKATAVAKSKATRKARGTLGTKQKKAVKGTVPATTAPSGGTVTTPATPTKPVAP